MEVKKRGRIPDSGSWRTQSGQSRASHVTGYADVGNDSVHTAIDDRSRLGYAERHPDKSDITAAGFLARAAAFYAWYGIRIQRATTDNVFADRNTRDPQTAAPAGLSFTGASSPASPRRRGESLLPSIAPIQLDARRWRLEGVVVKGTRGVGPAAAVAVALVAPLVAAGALVIRAASESPLESAAAADPLVGTIGRAERFGEVPVVIAVQYGEAHVPVAGRGGVVTSVGIAPGDEVVTGTVVASVNDQQLVAYTSDSPLFRDIARGLSGRDVTTAQELLASLGFDPGVADGNAGPAFERAVLAFNTENGYGDRNPVLSLASLVWVGTAPAGVADVSVTLGDTVIPGTALFTITAAPVAIRVTETPLVEPGDELELVFENVVVPYSQGSGQVTDGDAVAAIASRLGAGVEALAALRLVKPEEVATVPASAIVTDAAGNACLFSDAIGPPIKVIPLGGTLGAVDLDVSLAGQPVLFNPRQVRDDIACGGP